MASAIGLAFWLALATISSSLVEAGVVGVNLNPKPRSTEEVVAQLEQMKDKDSSAEDVGYLLSDADDKNTPNVIMGQFSVNDLLKLDNYSDADCKSQEFQKRQETCDKLKGHKALFNYCDVAVTFFKILCVEHQEEKLKALLRSKEFTEDMFKQLEDFSYKVDRALPYPLNDQLTLKNNVLFVKPVMKALSKEGKEYEEQIKSTCGQMVGVLSEHDLIKGNADFEARKIMINKVDLFALYKKCTILLNLNQVDKLKKLYNNDHLQALFSRIVSPEEEYRYPTAAERTADKFIRGFFTGVKAGSKLIPRHDDSYYRTLRENMLKP